MIIFSISLLLLNVNVFLKKKNKKIYRTFKKLKS